MTSFFLGIEISGCEQPATSVEVLCLKGLAVGKGGVEIGANRFCWKVEKREAKLNRGRTDTTYEGSANHS
jgi:hypothetical protein